MRIAALVLMAAIGATAAEGGKLDRVRDDVREDPPKPAPHSTPASTTSSSSSSADITIGGDDADDVLGTALLWVAATPFWGPMVALGDDFSPGWDASRAHQPRRAAADRLASVDAYGSWQDDGDGVTHRLLRVEASTRWRIGAQATVERLDEGDDHLTLGEADLLVRFAQGHGVALHAGIGGRWLRDDLGTEGGIDVLYGGEWWPIAPLVLRGEFSAGRIGEASAVEAWAHAGVAWRWVEVFGGVRWMRLGSVEFAGPVLGAALHY